MSPLSPFTSKSGGHVPQLLYGSAAHAAKDIIAIITTTSFHNHSINDSLYIINSGKTPNFVDVERWNYLIGFLSVFLPVLKA